VDIPLYFLFETVGEWLDDLYHDIGNQVHSLGYFLFNNLNGVNSSVLWNFLLLFQLIGPDDLCLSENPHHKTRSEVDSLCIGILLF